MPLDGTTERADTGAVDPTDYQPTDKPAPEPAEATPGITSATDTSVEPPLPEIADKPRKPRHKRTPVAEAARAVKSTVDTVKAGVDKARAFVSGGEKPITDNELTRAVRDKDAKRMRGVARYRRQTRAVVNPLIRAVFIQCGMSGVSARDVESVFTALQSVKTPVGYKAAKNGNISLRELPITDAFAYTLGSTALDVELWGARQWIRHPTLFDAAVLAGTGLAAYQTFTADDSPLKVAIRDIVEKYHAEKGEPIKAEAKVTDSSKGL